MKVQFATKFSLCYILISIPNCYGKYNSGHFEAYLGQHDIAKAERDSYDTKNQSAEVANVSHLLLELKGLVSVLDAYNDPRGFIMEAKGIVDQYLPTGESTADKDIIASFKKLLDVGDKSVLSISTMKKAILDNFDGSVKDFSIKLLRKICRIVECKDEVFNIDFSKQRRKNAYKVFYDNVPALSVPKVQELTLNSMSKNDLPLSERAKKKEVQMSMIYTLVSGGKLREAAALAAELLVSDAHSNVGGTKKSSSQLVQVYYDLKTRADKLGDPKIESLAKVPVEVKINNTDKLTVMVDGNTIKTASEYLKSEMTRLKKMSKPWLTYSENMGDPSTSKKALSFHENLLTYEQQLSQASPLDLAHLYLSCLSESSTHTMHTCGAFLCAASKMNSTEEFASYAELACLDSLESMHCKVPSSFPSMSPETKYLASALTQKGITEIKRRNEFLERFKANARTI